MDSPVLNLAPSAPAVPVADAPAALPPMPVLRGRSVVLRPFTAEDIDATYLGWLSDPHVTRFSNQRFVRHSRASCQRYLAGFAGSPNLFVSVRLPGPEGERRVGTLTAYRNPHHGTADIGILIGERAAWGQGVGLDAFRTLADWLAGNPGLHKLTAGTLACNHGMIRVAQRAGFTLEAVRRAQEQVEGRRVDMHLFARFVS
jgi:RimJ/RimL family protein N-acetyltransferase